MNYLSGVNELSAQELKNLISFPGRNCLPGYELKKLRHPEIFQGNHRTRKYFEGWYFKMVSFTGSSILCIIPGIALSRDGRDKHAFIQIIDGRTNHSSYQSFPAGEFSFSKKGFAISIGGNYFSEDRMILNIHSDILSISGEIQMSEHVKLPGSRLLNPGIMGWYRFVPFMQCYHGVVSLTHQLEGKLLKDGAEHNFTGGTGYIEKDWGSSMPSAWIWMQSNNFRKGNTSFMLSVADIPWLGSSFTGFLGFIHHNDTLYRFATYTHAKIEIGETGSDAIFIRIEDKKNIFLIEAVHKNAGILKAPVKGSMDRRIPESFDAIINLTVQGVKGNMIFCDSTSVAGMEMVEFRELISEMEGL